jgi:hypothetical protein
VFQSCVEELEDSIPEPPLPPMRMDVLGLKHDDVMNKVCTLVAEMEKVRYTCGPEVVSLPHPNLCSSCIFEVIYIYIYIYIFVVSFNSLFIKVTGCQD